MAKKTSSTSYDIATLQPDELNALKALVGEFITKIEYVDNEIETLKEDRKEIIEEYKERLDMKTLTAALKVVKIQQGVEHKNTYDMFLEVLTDPAQ